MAYKLAERKGWKFVDTDIEIVASTGMTIAEIFEKSGEEAFRDVESAEVAAVSTLPNAAIALGGGAVLRPGNRTVIASGGHPCIYLRCTAEELHRRISDDPETAKSRPRLTKVGGPLDEIKQLLAVREPLYREVATRELDVTELIVEAACDKILEWL